MIKVRFEWMSVHLPAMSQEAAYIQDTQIQFNYDIYIYICTTALCFFMYQIKYKLNDNELMK